MARSRIASKKSSSIKKRPSFNDMLKRASQKGSIFDSYLSDNFNTFKIKEGHMTIRILEPTWDNPDHYGYEVLVHRNIGPDNVSYLCLGMKDEPCPICEDREENSDDIDYATALKAKKRYIVWMINRDDVKAGPLLWSMAWTVDRDIAEVSIDRRNQDVYYIDDLEEGYDVFFKVEQVHSKNYKGPSPSGYSISRASSPALDDPKEMEKLKTFLKENPIPDCLNFYNYDYLKKVHIQHKKLEDENVDMKTGEILSSEDETEDDIPIDYDDKPESKKDDYTWEEIHALDAKALDELGEGCELDINSFTSDEELADEICKVKRIANPSTARQKLRGLRERAKK